MGIQINGQTNSISATPSGAVNISDLGVASKTTAQRNAGVSTSVGTIIYNTTTNEVQVYKEITGWVNVSNVGDTAPTGLTATGGVVSDYTDPGPGIIYRTHIFTSSGTFDVTALSPEGYDNVHYLVVGGGGAGGGQGRGGGGGAGGLRTNIPGTPLSISSTYSISVATYPVTVGGGGVSVPSTVPVGSSAGSFSRFGAPGTNPVWVYGSGGGAGGNRTDINGKDGGSGGGGGSGPGSGTGGSATTSSDPLSPSTQGSAGGGGVPAPGSPAYGGGGGGGAGGAGDAGTTSKGGNGGPGIQVLIGGPATYDQIGALNPGPGEYQWFAGGGGGGTYTENTLGVGGVGGGGTGGDHPNGPESPGFSGAPGTGGGGGGGGSTTDGPPGGHGGSGIVVVRYRIGSTQTDTAKATGGAISFYGSKTIHTFVASGSFTTPASFSETVEYVVVGGGGAGGWGGGNGGGGGAGAYRTGTTSVSGPQTISVQVGSGGAPSGDKTAAGGTGTSSFFGPPITSPGGGGGASDDVNSSKNGAPGGSGGGGGGGGTADANNTGATGTGDTFPGTIGATPANGWGNDGGTGGRGSSGDNGGGGGGGAGGVGGSNGPGQPGGLGGVGIQLPSTFRDSKSTVGAPGPTSPSVTGTDTSGNYWLAAGGGGASGSSGTQGIGGGSGGPYGGAGSGNSPGGNAALANTGSGGGGSTAGTGGGTGGSGIVIIAYPT